MKHLLAPEKLKKDFFLWSHFTFKIDNTLIFLRWTERKLRWTDNVAVDLLDVEIELVAKMLAIIS